ncbi:two-component sensor histidine kinase [Pseudoxanthomonas kalamensis DSM 18571]|uniref:sensor histidine kinase n=1 Tax=Pseudoxanthomonas kalamensis TaxID=289483 RepID=UPI00139092A9|nr:HAMP domain-containing sensor histidine kinase [Pseudoxanthomonas kalamensis]KAF1709338.1 two-component sensor histidine kinase [Pseudoxanthomonas kalamensis DSM 18571]
MKLDLTRKLSLVFAALLLVCSGTSAWLQLRATRIHEQEVVQGLSRGLAEHIAGHTQLMDANGLMPNAVERLFGQLMAVNPSVEVYLLDDDGRITGHAAPAGSLRRDRVDLAPVHRFIDGAALPILGDDPRSAGGRKVFSAAPLQVDGRDRGYVYVVLLGQAHDRFAVRGATSAALDLALWSIGLVALLCLFAGLTAFALITHPLRKLTDEVRRFDAAGEPVPPPTDEVAGGSNDEISVLRRAFHQMTVRLGEQWRALTRQDRERREFLANISHDLRTPLSSLHGYLETLLLKDATLAPDERRRYLGIALDQSRKVGTLARSLFELARLEQGFVQPEWADFAVTDLVQDVLQKFELDAGSRQVTLKADAVPPLPAVHADLGLVERVLTNLIDNALRHVPAGGDITIALAAREHGVEVQVSDSGPGIPADLRERLFRRADDDDATLPNSSRPDGGLGLRIVQQILQLHGSRLELLDLPGRGAAFLFMLPRADRTRPL